MTEKIMMSHATRKLIADCGNAIAVEITDNEVRMDKRSHAWQNSINRKAAENWIQELSELQDELARFDNYSPDFSS